MLTLAKNSLGVGDRFAHQAKAQLQACVLARGRGIEVIPVWNKSNREHLTIGSEPAATRQAADAAVQQLGWNQPYHVDADHIRLETVDRFVPHADFYTIDVADWIGKPAEGGDIEKFVRRHPELTRRLDIPGIEQPVQTTPAEAALIAAKYLRAVQEAGTLYRHIVEAKGKGK